MSDPWTSIVHLGEVAGGLVKRQLSPTEVERKAIARELDLVELPQLQADVAVEPWFDGARISGRWQATVVQTCGITLEPLTSELGGDFDLKAVPGDSIRAPSVEAQLSYDPDAEDVPDILETDRIDLAAYVVEHLALEIDPFPRKPGAEFQPPDMGPEPGPFDALKKLKGTEG